MKPSDFISLEYRLSHAAEGSQRRLIIDSYPSLHGKSVREVNNLIKAHKLVTEGKTFAEQARVKRIRQGFAVMNLIRRKYR